MSFLDDLFSGDGMGPIHGLIWIGLGIWAIVGLFFLPACKEKAGPDKRTGNGLA